MATTKRTVEILLSDDEVKQALAAEARRLLGNEDLVLDSVSYVIEERGGDPLDRLPGVPTVTGVTVTFKR